MESARILLWIVVFLIGSSTGMINNLIYHGILKEPKRPKARLAVCLVLSTIIIGCILYFYTNLELWTIALTAIGMPPLGLFLFLPHYR